MHQRRLTLLKNDRGRCFLLPRRNLKLLYVLPRHHDAVKRYAYLRFVFPFPLDPGKQMLGNIIALKPLRTTLVVMLNTYIYLFTFISDGASNPAL